MPSNDKKHDDGNASDFTSRPDAKRIRPDEDASKASVKNKNDEEGKDDHKDDDWLSLPPFRVGASWDGWTTKWRESCWCGKTAFVYDSDPLQVKYCHCEDCQRLHAAPFQHAAIFKKDSIRLDSSPEWLGFLSAHGEVHPLSDTPTPLPRKTSCRACGSNLFDEGKNMIMAFPPAFEFPRTLAEIKQMQEESKKPEQSGPHGKGEAVHTGKTGLPDAFKAQCHIFYERRIMDIKDGLIKWRRHKEESEEMGEEQRP